MTTTHDTIRENQLRAAGVEADITHPGRHDRAVVELDTVELDRIINRLGAPRR